MGRIQLGAKQTPDRAAYGFLADYSKDAVQMLTKIEKKYVEQYYPRRAGGRDDEDDADAPVRDDAPAR